MSVLAVEEYEELQVNFELEKDLRKRAESLAHEVFKSNNIVRDYFFNYGGQEKGKDSFL